MMNLVRIYNLDNISSKSYIYKVPSEFEKSRKLLNSFLAEAIFANKVLLVEGPSEELLFNRVLLSVKPNYEALGLYILSIHGIYFDKFIEVLNPLGITCIVKTDNDIMQYKIRVIIYQQALRDVINCWGKLCYLKISYLVKVLNNRKKYIKIT